MSSLLCPLLLWLVVWVAPTTQARDGGDGGGGRDEFNGLVDGSSSQVGRIVGQVVKHHLAGCHLVLASTTTTDHTTVFSSGLRRLVSGGHASTIVDVDRLFSQDQPTQDRLLRGLWGDARATCRALILHTGDSGVPFSLKFLEASGLWLEPDTTTVVIGGSTAVTTIVHHAGLRNTIHLILLALDDVAPPIPPVQTLLRNGTPEKVSGSERVRLYRRCLYCNDGQMGVHLVQRGNLPSGDQWHNLLPERLEHFGGHMFKVLTLNYFPFTAYEKKSKGPGALLAPLDSLDSRVLHTLSGHLNFTYELREPWDGTWGVPLAGSNWSGIVGTLQYEQADFSLNLTPSPTRMEVITHSIIYSHDPMNILSLKPRTLPRSLALIRPFTVEVWLMIILCTSVAGVILWLLQKAWSSMSGHRSLGFDSAFLQSWGFLLQEPAVRLPTNISGQMFLGWWWLWNLTIVTAYLSSLVAHLSVQDMFPPINTFEDILSRDGWAWGIHPSAGTTFLYFNQSSDPVIQEIHKGLQIYLPPDGVERVMAGGFSYITFRSYIKVETGSRYQVTRGTTPIHLSTTEYPINGGNSWGSRRGAPFLGQIRRLKQRLIEAGLIDRWTDDIIETTVKQVWATRGGEEDRAVHSEVDDGQVVLGLDHLQGVFYLLLLGYLVAIMNFLWENLVHGSALCTSLT